MTTFELSEPITAPVPVIPVVSKETNTKAVRPHWMKSWTEFKATVKWEGNRAVRRAMFHTLRSPWYGLRCVGWSLRAQVIIPKEIIMGVWDSEARADYKAMSRGHERKAGRTDYRQDRKTRAGYALGFFAAKGVLELAYLASLWFDPLWIDTLVTTVIVGATGFVGRPRDKQLIEPAVLPQKLEKASPDRIYQALADIGVASLDNIKPFGDGLTRDNANQLQFIELALYGGAIADNVIKKRKALAGALGRNVGTVWPQKGSGGENTVKIVLTDHELADLPQQPSPLLSAKRTDSFAPIPVGVDEMGNPSSIPGAGNGHYFAAAGSGGGKSTFARNVISHFVLDPTSSTIILDAGGNGEYDEYDSATRFHLSARDDEGLATMLRCLQWVEETEVTRRAQLLASLPRGIERKVTREVVDMLPGLGSMLIVLDEANKLFFHPDLGAEARRAFASIADQSRKLGITLLPMTQRGASTHMPIEIKCNLLAARWAGVLDGQPEVDAVLGTGAWGNGAHCNEIALNTGLGYVGNGEGGFEPMRVTRLTPQEQAQIVDKRLMQPEPIEKLQFPKPVDQELPTEEQGPLLQRLLELQTADGYDPKGIWSKDFHYVCEDFKVSDVQLRKALKEAGVAVKGVEMYDVDKGKVTTKQGFRFDELAKALGE
jgi:S-DNA-T family DNA segregation ATPase FtsK/SpoIIIE